MMVGGMERKRKERKKESKTADRDSEGQRGLEGLASGSD